MGASATLQVAPSDVVSIFITYQGRKGTKTVDVGTATIRYRSLSTLKVGSTEKMSLPVMSAKRNGSAAIVAAHAEVAVQVVDAPTPQSSPPAPQPLFAASEPVALSALLATLSDLRFASDVHQSQALHFSFRAAVPKGILPVLEGVVFPTARVRVATVGSHVTAGAGERGLVTCAVEVWGRKMEEKGLCLKAIGLATDVDVSAGANRRTLFFRDPSSGATYLTGRLCLSAAPLEAARRVRRARAQARREEAARLILLWWRSIRDSSPRVEGQRYFRPFIFGDIF